MAEKSDHFMMEFKGPAKQFVALVGDVGGAVNKTKVRSNSKYICRSDMN